MDCQEVIEKLNQLPHLLEITNEIKEGLRIKDIKYPLSLRKILHFVNRSDVINCLEDIPTSLIDIFVINEPISKSKIIKNYLELGFSEHFINKVLLYQSGRPKVDMTNLLPSFKYYPPEWRSLIIPHFTDSLFWVADCQNGIFNNTIIPVIRYQTGMHGYLTTPQKGSYCGTFYYYEPDSPYLLYSETTLVTTNKITACLELGLSVEWIANRLEDNSKHNIVLYYDEDGEEYEIEYTPKNVGFNVSGSKSEQWIELINQYKNNNINSLIHYQYLYALEDTFDQIICVLAHNRNINTILLKNMTGETRVVSEVLDVRSRVESYNNIYLPEYYLDFKF